MSQQTNALNIRKKALTAKIKVGMAVKTKFMEPFIVLVNSDGLYTFDLDATLEKIKITAKFINRVGVENVIVCSSNHKAETAIEKFCELTGTKKYVKRFMPGTLTNPSYDKYVEPKLVLVSSPQIDEQVVTEATNAGIPVVGIANTDNVTSKLDLIIPANNQGRRPLACVYWLMARQVLIEKGELTENESMEYSMDDFEYKGADDDDGD